MPSRECVELAKANAHSRDRDGTIAVVTRGTQCDGEAISGESAEIGVLTRSRQDGRLPRQLGIRLDDRCTIRFEREAGDVDTAAVLMETASGRTAQIPNSRSATCAYDQRIEVHGSKGMLRAGNILETAVEMATSQGFRADPVQKFILHRYAAGYRAELGAFINPCAGKTAHSPTGLGRLRAQLLTESARTGGPLAIKAV